MSQDTIRVASTAPMSFRITEPRPDNTRPGESPDLKSAIINGGGHGETITEGVDAKLFRDWMKANESSPIVVNGLLREVESDDEQAGEIEYGFEPALERAVKDAEGDAKEASMAGDKRASEVDMDAHSNVPNDDSPRSQTETGPAFVAPAAAPEPGLAPGQAAPAPAAATAAHDAGGLNPASPAKPAESPHTTETQPFDPKPAAPEAGKPVDHRP